MQNSKRNATMGTFTGLTRHLAAMLALAVGAMLPNEAQAGRLDALFRQALKMADDAPIGSVDEMAERLAKSGLAREAIEADLRRSGRLPQSLDDAGRAARRATEVDSALRAATSGFDPRIVRAFEALDPATRETALLLCRGGDEVAATIPDLAARSRFLQRAGPDTVAAVGAFGKPAMDSALRLDMALRVGDVVLLPGKRAVTVADFGRLMTTYANRADTFWQRYVLPHWKKWLASGALAWYLVDPEGFMDNAGTLTEEGFRRLTEVVGAVAARAIQGTAEGSGSAVSNVATAVRDSYFSGWRGVVSLVGTLCILSIALPRTRRWVLRPLRWLCTTSPKKSKSGVTE